ncbi:MAG TPA: DNA mismatch repair protein [Mycobacteriales bacterium]|nr:DNA mismatch repair protein [Mycobacteriales bacterium]
MKVRLMFPDADADRDRHPPAHAADLIGDLGAEVLIETMAGGDRLLERISRLELIDGSPDPAAVTYRQDVLRDLIAHPSLARDLYELSGEALDIKQQVRYGWVQKTPTAVLNRSVQVMELLVDCLRRLRGIAGAYRDDVRSLGLRLLFERVCEELDEPYLQQVEEHLHTLEFRRDVPISRRFGAGLAGRDYLLHDPQEFRRSMLDWMPLTHDRYTLVIPPRDDAAYQALEALRDRAVNDVANALGQSVDDVLGFFAALQWEVGFYLACLNLSAELERRGAPWCFPSATATPSVLEARTLYDVGLRLRTEGEVVGSDVDAQGRPLIVITGANQGGKSTFLRAIGLAQLMLQAGMFVAAEAQTASVTPILLTHFKREEDRTMESGKLDEELRRMSTIVDVLRPGALLLSNESFAATNEREGSQLGRDLFDALTDCGVRVVAVTHLTELARTLQRDRADQSVFLRAERQPDGTRTFRLTAGAPQGTGYGVDLYRRVFGSEPTADETADGMPPA